MKYATFCTTLLLLYMCMYTFYNWYINIQLYIHTYIYISYSFLYLNGIFLRLKSAGLLKCGTSGPEFKSSNPIRGSSTIPALLNVVHSLAGRFIEHDTLDVNDLGSPSCDIIILGAVLSLEHVFVAIYAIWDLRIKISKGKSECLW